MTDTAVRPQKRPVISAGAWCQPINGFRGVAAVIVVIGHAFEGTRIFPYTGVIHFISIVVPAFFVVSAYALYRPYIVSQLKGEQPVSARSFWWRRFLRIYPLFAVALTAYLILLPGVRPHGGAVIDYIRLYTFQQVYFRNLVTFSGIPAAWFICDEVAFYLMIPAIAGAARRLAVRLDPRRAGRADVVLRAHTLIAIGMIVVGQVSRTWFLRNDVVGATSLPISNADYYGLGILLAVGSLRERSGISLPKPVEWIRLRPWFALAVLAAGAVLMNVIAKIPGGHTGTTEDIQRYAIYSVMVVPFMTVMCLGHQDRWFNGWFASPRWTLLATISLHTYLWHQLVLGGADRLITAHTPKVFGKVWTGLNHAPIGGRFTTGVVLVIAAVLVTVAWSALLRPTLDLPYKKFSRALDRRRGPLDRTQKTVAIGIAVALLGGGAALALEYGGSPLHVRGGVGQIAVTDADPGDTVSVRRGDREVATATADQLGAAVVRKLKPGRYSVHQIRDGKTLLTRSATVLTVADHPDAGFYGKTGLHPGMNEIPTRDGTRLAAWVTLPGPADAGPYPTVVEYSGYQIADPKITQPATAVARALGYATVGVNVRGSGCSAGAFEMLSDAQAADGYDVIETVARQSWVKGGSVGLVGFSYGGLGALEVASTAPPSLNSVVALSVYGTAWQALHPGGLANSGFPVGWMQDLNADNQPSGAPWIKRRIAGGDDACRRNQDLHGQAIDLKKRYLGPGIPHDHRFDALDVAHFAAGVKVPVFLSGQLQDATIGTDLADQLDRFAQAPLAKLVLTNGTHGDAVAPQVLRRMDQFMAIYAATRTPTPFDTAALLRKTRPEMKDPSQVPDGPDLPVPVDPSEAYDTAKARYEAGPKVEVLFESGGTADHPEAAAATSSVTFGDWPPSPAEAGTVGWRLRPGGRLDSSPVDTAGGVGVPDPAALFSVDPDVSGDAYNIEGSDLVTNSFSRWVQPKRANAASWVTPPLAQDTAVVGDAHLDIWVRSSGSDAAIQGTLSQVAPNGDETMVQVGWIRARDGRLQSDGTPGEARSLEPDEWTQVRLTFGPVGQLVRKGSRLRLVLGTPGAGQVQWSFYRPPGGAVDVAIGQGGQHGSVLFLPVAPGVSIPSHVPACGDLRGQPCRRYKAFENREGPDAP